MPRFYLDVLEQEVRSRHFRWHHPFTHRPMELVLEPSQGAVIVLWSKDFGGFLRRREAFEGWPLFFHFTINSPVSTLEPDLPPLARRLGQMETLAAHYGPRAVRWRFDPIVLWEQGGSVRDNLRGLAPIARAVADIGLETVTVSFMDRYRKIERRTQAGFSFRYPLGHEMVEIFRPYSELLRGLGFTVTTCCEPALTELPGVRKGRCIDATLLSAISGLALRGEPDVGQRVQHGCGCHRSIDIGCYAHHRCRGACLYCYARP